MSTVGKLYNAVYVVRPGRYVVHRLLRLVKLHLIGEESRSGGDALDRLRKKVKAERGLKLTPEFMEDVGC